MKHFPLILLGVLLNAAAQILLKRGMTHFPDLPLSWEGIAPALPRLATSLPILSALGCYGISVVVWMAVLSKVDVSLAYPMLSIGYLVVLAYGLLFGAEQVGWERISGTFLIGAGVFLLFRSA